jgi:hypothetical protein
VLLPVLAAACVLWTLRLDWWPYLDGRPTELTRVAAGERATYAGTGFEVTATTRVPGGTERGERLDLAPDATLVVVTLRVDPDPALSCTVEAVAGDVRWDTAGFDETSWSPPDRFESSCTTDEPGAYDLRLGFVVPSSAADDLELEVSDLRRLPEALRLGLS